MNVLIGVISPAAAWNMPRHFVDQLRNDFPHHTFTDAWDREAVRRGLRDAEAAFTPVIEPTTFASCSGLRWVQVPAVGIDQLLYPAMIESRVVITNARGIRARPIAEHVMGVALSLARQFHSAMRHQVAHEWAQDRLEGLGTTSIQTLQGRRIGIVGLGAIGSAIAQLASRFGLRISAIRRRIEQGAPDEVDELMAPERLDDLLAASDIVVLSAPVTSATQTLIGPHELAVMKPGAFLINIGRGALVDETPLVEALRSGRIGGAALDVFNEEPLNAASPLWDLPNVIITPHTSGTMEDYWTPLVALFADNLRRLESGLPLLNVVDKVAGY